MNEVLTDIAYTPFWVWPLLAVLIWRGAKSLKPRIVSLRDLVLMPAILIVLSLHNLTNLGASASTISGLCLGALVGTALGFMLERRHPAVPGDNGTLVLPGEWSQMVVVISIFLTRYVGTVIGITHPGLANSSGVVMAMAGLSGLFAAMMLTRTLTRLRLVYASRAACQLGA